MAPSTDVFLKECLDSFMWGFKNCLAGDKISLEILSPNKNPLTTGPQRPAIFSDKFLKMGAEQLPKTRKTDNRLCTNFTPAKVKTRTESRIENGHVSDGTDDMWKGDIKARMVIKSNNVDDNVIKRKDNKIGTNKIAFRYLESILFLPFHEEVGGSILLKQVLGVHKKTSLPSRPPPLPTALQVSLHGVLALALTVASVKALQGHFALLATDLQVLLDGAGAFLRPSHLDKGYHRRLCMQVCCLL